MKKKTILITGASDGIGKETAKALARQGHIIIMHGRNPQKTAMACEEVKTASGNENVEYLIADFLSLAEVRRFAEEVKSRYDHLDVLINNAGAQFGNIRETSVDGHEKTIAINLLAPYLLTTLLLDLLRRSSSARVVTVASESHRMGGQPIFDDMELERNYSLRKSYGLSKLYVIWMMRHFVKESLRMGIANITFNTVHPGSATTNLDRVAKGDLLTRIVYILWRPMMKTAAEGAKSSIYAATSPEIEGITGRYYGLKGEERPSDRYYTEENELKVWNYCRKAAKDFVSI